MIKSFLKIPSAAFSDVPSEAREPYGRERLWVEIGI
jgi:hypothetical protein